MGVSFFTSGGVESNLKPDVQLKLNEFSNLFRAVAGISLPAHYFHNKRVLTLPRGYSIISKCRAKTRAISSVGRAPDF